MNQEFYNRQEVKDFELYKLHTPLTLQKYEIDTMERVLTSQGIRNISVNQFSGGDKESVGAVMPLLGFGAAQLRTGTM